MFPWSLVFHFPRSSVPVVPASNGASSAVLGSLYTCFVFVELSLHLRAGKKTKRLQRTHKHSSMAATEPVNEPGQSEAGSMTEHHLTVPAGLTEAEFDSLRSYVAEFHTYRVEEGKQCSSLLAQKVHAPRDVVWKIVRRFDKPQIYKHFIKSCIVKEGFTVAVGCTRDVNVISGLPAATSTERLDILDDERYVTGFTIIGGDHRLRNYRAVTSVHEIGDSDGRDDGAWSVVLESYVVDVPEGNTEEDTRLFADTVVKLNLQKLASVAVAATRGDGDGGASPGSGDGR